MEGNEVEKAALAYARNHSQAPDKETPDWIITDFTAGANWQKERDKIELSNYAYQMDRAKRDRDKAEAELTRANARIKELDDKYLKLSQQYDDLYRKHKP